jgi:hypothetical protein
MFPMAHTLQELSVKASALFPVTALFGCLLLTACQPASPSARQQASAEAAADEYRACIRDLDRKTATEAYTNATTRRDVVLESCRESLNRFTVVQEQAYSNACLARGNDAGQCDRDAVRHTSEASEQLQHEAAARVDRSSAAARRPAPR